MLLILALGFAALNLIATWHRSLIPLALDGTISAIEVRPEKHPGIDDVWLVTIGNRRLHVDAATGRALSEGAQVAKPAWGRRLTVDGAALPLAPSRDARAMLAVMPLAVVAAGLAVHLNRRRPT